MVGPMSASASTGTAITGSGVWTPSNVVSNDELCAAFNEFVRHDNARHADAIASGAREPLRESTPEFVLKASGIKHRHVHDRDGLLDPARLCPSVPDRPGDQLSVQGEYALHAAERALAAAGRSGADVDLIIVTASALQRPYPATAIEVQDALGAGGFAYDTSVGCSSATFSIQVASEALRCGSASCALVIAPELMTGQTNFRDRDSHFLFGDASAAVVIEPLERARPGAFEIVSTRAMSKYSTNIRNNAGFLNRWDPANQFADDKLFHQQGRRVFKDVVPLAARFIGDHVAANGLDPARIHRYWLHQANRNMNDLIAHRLLGREPSFLEAPLILDDHGNTAAAGAIIAFSKYHDDLPTGAVGVIATFGAGYSLGSVLLRRT